MNLSRRHLVFGSLALPALAAKKPGETPHIVLILAENLPAWMLGCYGNKEIQTLHIDRLAQTGTRFQTHIAGHALPGPARASLLTGNAAGKTPNLDQLLGAAGYATRSVNSGAEAVQFIDDPASAAKPFFLTVTLSALTPPYPAAAKYLDRFANARFQTWEQVPAAGNIAADKDAFGANLLPSLRKAAASVAAIDDEVGSITGKLREKKLLDNTLIIFTAPTGSLLGRHGLWGGSTASDPANFFEEVIAPPIIWTWPARITPLGVRPEIASAFDLVPTLCDLTPATLPSQDLPGRSYLLLVQGKLLPKKQPWRSTAFLTSGNDGVARDDRYKLVLRNDGKGPNELYDLRADAQERVSQFDNPQFLTVKTQLSGELNRWRQKYAG
ncbi:MAG TPA: sulfatase-like hydrolase/transferase [Candidatus Acidoferrum sp.]|nr:sulfatase-like hydrolase/transferase [Candidatus Acidoferrum sp.]